MWEEQVWAKEEKFLNSNESRALWFTQATVLEEGCSKENTTNTFTALKSSARKRF